MEALRFVIRHLLLHLWAFSAIGCIIIFPCSLVIEGRAQRNPRKAKWSYSQTKSAPQWTASTKEREVHLILSTWQFFFRIALDRRGGRQASAISLRFGFWGLNFYSGFSLTPARNVQFGWASSVNCSTVVKQVTHRQTKEVKRRVSRLGLDYWSEPEVSTSPPKTS